MITPMAIMNNVITPAMFGYVYIRANRAKLLGWWILFNIIAAVIQLTLK